MKISKINKIHGCRTFNDFSWPTGLDDFKDYNLIYGWNGTGKTTISDICRAIERKQTHFDGEFTVQTDIGALKSSDLDGTWGTTIPPIRVFNRDYVTANVFPPSDGEMTPIFYLGEESVEKQKQVETKKQEIEALIVEKTLKGNETKAATTALNDLCVSGGTAVREALLSSGGNYNNYDKRAFTKKIEAICALSLGEAAQLVQNEEQKISLKARFGGTIKDPITVPPFTLPDLEQLKTSTNAILQRSVVSQALGALQESPKLAQWVKQGLDIHEQAGHKDCQFCLGVLSTDRLKDLNGHFNEEYDRIISDITTTKAKLDAAIRTVEGFAPIDKAAVCDHLTSKYNEAASALKASLGNYASFLKAMKAHLDKKQGNPFETISAEDALPNNALQEYNNYDAVLKEHDTYCANHEADVADAREKYEAALVVGYVGDYQAAKKVSENVSKAFDAIEESIKTLNGEIATLETAIREHRKPAEEINADLLLYLGHEELKLETKDNGYIIFRFSQPAKDLSEGERTAIALLHFLKSLEDKNFSPPGIVVIDDPVTSMDDGALFHAFGYIKEKTKNVKQLFILTHNFLFFRQVKNWFKFANDRSSRKASFYQTICTMADNKRRSNLVKADRLLTEYESEYHYLFSLVNETANDPGTDELGKFYSMPNVARRVLESFLAFRKPSEGSLYAMLNAIDFDPVQKTKILRFCHVYSHDDSVVAPEHDPSLLAETPQVMKSILALMQEVDKGHYEEMLKVLNRATSQTMAGAVKKVA